MRSAILITTISLAFSSLLTGCETTHPGETPEQRAMRQQQGLNMMMLGNQMMTTRPAYTPMPRPRVCNTIRSGMGYQTICN